MSLVDVGRALRKRWRVIVIVTLIAELLAAAYVALATPKYDAKAELFVTSPAGNASPATTFTTSSFIATQMSSYVDIARREPVLAPVVKQLGLPFGWQTLAGEVSAANPPNTALITVTVRDASAARAQAIANAVTQHFASEVEQIETVGSETTSPVKATVVQRAVLPTSPSSPNLVLILAGVGVIGLALGIGLALLRSALDTSVKSPDDIRDRLKAVPLGTIPYDRDTPKHPVVVGQHGGAGRSEAFRQLRTNLQFVELDERPRSIVITSSVAGEGKTTTACNIAAALAQLGVNVILLEGDLRRPRVATYLGLENAVGLTSVLLGWTSWREALQDWGTGEAQLRVLASGPLPPNPSELIAGQQMRTLLQELEEECDVVIIDGPPLLPVADSTVLATTATGALLVVRQGKTRHDQVARAIQALEAVDARLYGVVLNMARRSAGAYDYDYYYYYQKSAPRTDEFTAALARATAGSGETLATSNGAAKPRSRWRGRQRTDEPSRRA
ncbi:MAG TPA: polysaccharide biosynthesis tyrosine autokinase [Mycobacteriales bacterium]|nr:polysaccharide biosynthesis tyrosine autokinase [Mycobacteriales bacterium]